MLTLRVAFPRRAFEQRNDEKGLTDASTPVLVYREHQ